MSDILPLFPDLVRPPPAVQSLEGICEDVLHTNLQTGFVVAKIRTPQGVVVVAGKGDAFSPGDSVEARGVFEVHAKYGRQMKAEFLGARIPETAAGILAYLASGAVPGVGPRMAQRLVEAHGDRLVGLMGSVPALMSAGLTEVRARAIVDHWAMRTRYGRLLAFLNTMRAGPALAKKLIDAYGDATYGILMTDPYRPAREVHGVGFITADRMALSQGVALDHPDRIGAAMIHVMQQRERSGSCATARLDLIVEVSKILMVPDKVLDTQINRLLVLGELVEEPLDGRPVLFRKVLREAEIELARRVMERLQPMPLADTVEADIQAMAVACGVPPLHEGQAAAVKISLGARLSIITGNPGTGKTSSVAVLLGMLRAQAPEGKILMAAPTGRAARRMSEQTNQPSVTLHRLLGFAPGKRGFTFNEENPLDCDALIIDEVSMLDLFLARDVMRALPPHARLVLVGDVDQLPSVGVGNVLGDLIHSGTVPVGRLTKIFRQGAGSEIARACQRINTGQVPVMARPSSDTDFWGIIIKTPEEAQTSILDVVCRKLPDLGYIPLRDAQVLVPGKRSASGVHQLNPLLQNALNPPRPNVGELDCNTHILRLYDRVIQDDNNYDLEVYNGDIGFIVEVTRAGVTVDFDGRLVQYEGSDLKALSPAYCTTIHRSQGSEFPAVVVGITTQHFLMLQRNLIYTAISRAKRLCCVVGQQRAIMMSVRNGKVGRLTGLRGRLTTHALQSHMGS